MPIQLARLHDPRRSASLCEEAENLLARGERLEAAAVLESAMRFDPGDENLSLMAAGLYFEEGQLDRAAELALESTRVRPFNPSAMNLLGVICLDAGQENLARKLLERTCAMTPGFERAAGNLKQARRACRKRRKQRNRANSTRLAGRPLQAVRDLLRPREQRLTACILARREDGLVACVTALDEVVDEVVVLDATAGGEAERSIAGKNRRVHRFEYDGDLAAAHNELLRHSRGDWLLFIDAAELLESDSAQTLREALTDEHALSHGVEVRYGPAVGRIRETRLFRNASGLRFAGRALAEIRPALKQRMAQWALRERHADVVIEGADSPPLLVSWESALPEHSRSLEREQREASDEFRKWLCEARREIAAGSPRRALGALDATRSTLAQGTPAATGAELEELVTLEGLCLLRLGLWNELSTLVGKYHDEHSPTHNTLFLEGLAARAAGTPHLAAQRLRACLDTGDSASFVLPFPELVGPAVPNLLGTVLLDLGDGEAAGQAFRDALQRKPDDLEALVGLLGLRLMRKEYREVLEELECIVRDRGDDPRVWTVGAALLERAPALAAEAEAWTEEGCRRYPDNATLRRQFAEARLRRGHAEPALGAWEAIGGGDPADLAGRFAASLLLDRELPEVPEGWRDAIGSGVMAWFQLWLVCASYESLDLALTRIERAESKLPGFTRRTADWLDRIDQPEAAERLRERKPQPA